MSYGWLQEDIKKTFEFFLFIQKNFYFANACEDLPFKSNIFIGVSFRKILGFYYKRNRLLFYYEGTSSYIPLKITEHVNRVLFQNSIELFVASENNPAAKNMFKADNKGIFQEFYSADFIIRLVNIFEVCDGVWFS